MKIFKNNSGLPFWSFIIFGTVILVIIKGGLWLYETEAQQSRQKIISQLAFTNELKAQQIQQWREQRLAHASDIMTSPFFVQGVMEWKTNRRSDIAEKLLSRFKALALYYHYSNILLVDAAGEVLLSLTQTKERLPEADLIQLKPALAEQKPFLTDLYLSEKENAPVMDVIVPLFEQKDDLLKPVGALILKIDPNTLLFPLIKSWLDSTTTAETILVRREGNQVVFLNPTRYRAVSPFELKISLSRKKSPAVNAVLGKEGVGAGPQNLDNVLSYES